MDIRSHAVPNEQLGVRISASSSACPSASSEQSSQSGKSRRTLNEDEVYDSDYSVNLATLHRKSLADKRNYYF